MIPILYDAKETEFKDNGIGRLICSDCKVNEKLNDEFELEATVDFGANKHASYIQNDNIILATTEYDEEPQPFQIYEVVKNLDGSIDISAEHISYRQNHIPVNTFHANSPSEAFAQISRNSIEPNPFTYYTDVHTEGTLKVEEPMSVKEVLGDDDEHGIIGVFKSGEYKYDRFKVSLLDRRGRDTDIMLRYGDNVKSLKQTENVEDLVTGIVPYYKKTEDDATTIVMLPSKVYYSKNAGAYAYHKTQVIDLSSSFDDEPTPEALLEYVKSKLGNVSFFSEPEFKITIDFKSLFETAEYEQFYARFQKLKMGDMVHAVFKDLDITATGEVTETEWDVLNDCYSKITIGNASKGIAATIRNLAEANARKEAMKLTNLLKGDKDKDKSVSGQVRVTIESDTPQIMTNLDLDAVFGLKPGTSNSKNTSVTFVNADPDGNSWLSNYYYGGDGWYAKSSVQTGTTYVNYTAIYFGGSS